MATALAESGSGEKIQSFTFLLVLFRYGDTWTQWRRCGVDAGGEEEMLELDAGSNEGISRVNGYSTDSDGLTSSLEASTTASRSWGPHGYHSATVESSLRKSPNARGMRLRFLSGNQTEEKYILR